MQLQKAAGGLVGRQCGSIACMDDEMREKIIVACTEAAMTMEELSVKALGAAEMEPEDLPNLMYELQPKLSTVLEMLDWNSVSQRSEGSNPTASAPPPKH
jgi:hypothetical protein